MLCCVILHIYTIFYVFYCLPPFFVGWNWNSEQMWFVSVVDLKILPSKQKIRNTLIYTHCYDCQAILEDTKCKSHSFRCRWTCSHSHVLLLPFRFSSLSSHSFYLFLFILISSDGSPFGTSLFHTSTIFRYSMFD